MMISQFIKPLLRKTNCLQFCYNVKVCYTKCYFKILLNLYILLDNEERPQKYSNSSS